MVNRNDIKDVELTKFRIYKSQVDGGLYLSLNYICEAKDGTHELHLPKIKLEIWDNKLPIVIENTPFSWADGCRVDLGAHRYDLERSKFDVTDKFGNTQHLSNAYYADCLIRENVKEMTLEEIERSLGHKVKIVSEKGD